MHIIAVYIKLNTVLNYSYDIKNNYINKNKHVHVVPSKIYYLRRAWK